MNKEQSEQVSLKRKTIRIVAVLLLFVVLPAISWYYLSKGLNWRKEATAELGQYGKIRGSYIVFPNNDKVDILDNSVCVLHIFGYAPDLTAENKKILDDAHKMQKQFGMIDEVQVRPNFKLVMIAEKGTAEFRSHYQQFPSIDNVTWVMTGGLGSWRTIIENGYDKYCKDNNISPVNSYYALADTSGQIRRFYNALDDKEVGRMVEHIAILLPKE